MPHSVYILQSTKDNGYYIVETTNIDARLRFHNKGLQRSTKSRRPFIIAHIETYPDRTKALKREKEIKSWKGGIKFKRLIEGSSPAQRGTTFGIPQGGTGSNPVCPTRL
ncbi:MAG: GIY-YIG nuclease family protein [Bacteroidota bacterium]